MEADSSLCGSLLAGDGWNYGQAGGEQEVQLGHDGKRHDDKPDAWAIAQAAHANGS